MIQLLKEEGSGQTEKFQLTQSLRAVESTKWRSLDCDCRRSWVEPATSTLDLKVVFHCWVSGRNHPHMAMPTATVQKPCRNLGFGFPTTLTLSWTNGQSEVTKEAGSRAKGRTKDCGSAD